jgi:putative phage-type endonuclease
MTTKKVYKTREEWLADRNKGFIVGGSNIGIILGLDWHTTPYQLWYRHKNGEQDDTSQRMYRGQFMENAIAGWFENETGFKVVKKSAEISVFKNDKYPDYMQVSPDRELFAHGAKSRPLVEIKDTAYRIDIANPETLPKSWYAQLQYQMGMMERELCYLVINDGNKNLQYHPFEFDPEFFYLMIKQVREWVERYIIGDEIPPITTPEDIAIAFPRSQPVEVQVGTTFKTDVYDQLAVKKEAAKRLDGEIEKLSNRMKCTFEAADTLVYEGMILATYKTNAKGVRTLKMY